MWNDPDQELEQRLGPGEQLLWRGQPQSGIHFQAMDIFFIPFSVVWCGFAIFWEFMVLTQLPKANGPEVYVFPIFGVPFVLIGLYMVFGRFIVESHIRKRTSYAVTNERVIVVRSWFQKSITSLDLKTLSDITLTERSDGSGTITFGPANPFMPLNLPFNQLAAPPTFERFEDAKKVYDLIRRAQKSVT